MGNSLNSTFSPTARALLALKAPWAAQDSFNACFHSAVGSTLGGTKRPARMLHTHSGQIEHSSPQRLINADLEAANTTIKEATRRWPGFRSHESFRRAIYLHCGGPDRYPAGITRVQ
jgi:transposase